MPPRDSSPLPSRRPIRRYQPSIDGLAIRSQSDRTFGRPPVSPAPAQPTVTPTSQDPATSLSTPTPPMQSPQTASPVPMPPSDYTHNQPAATSNPNIQRSFTPPSPRKQRPPLWLTATAVVVLLLVASGFGWWWHVGNEKNSPTAVFKAALLASFATTQVEVQTASPHLSSQVSFDFTNSHNPLVSSQETLKWYGSIFELQGYGSTSNTYATYYHFPSTIAANISNAAQNGWIQLRSGNKLPPGVSATLANVAEPRYQAFGPLMFANLPLNTRTQLLTFALSHHIYSFKPDRVYHATVGGSTVLAYPVSLNINYLKLLMQSVATNEGFDPSDVQAAVNALNDLNPKGTLYISTATHRFVQASFHQAGQTDTLTYDHYGNASLPGEPQTRLNWQDFKPVQLQIEQQAAHHQSPAQLDAERAADLAVLHAYLATYFTANGYYPTFAELDDQGWLATNLPGLDPDVIRDPLGAAFALTQNPTANAYAYQPATPSGKACDNNPAPAVSQLCTSYRLTAILSDGRADTVQSP